MVEVDKFRLFLKLIILGIFVYALGALQGNNFAGAGVPAQTPKITVASQPDAPINISSITVSSPDPLAPEFTYVISTKSEKPIEAFTIRYIANSEGATDEALELTLASMPDAFLYQGQVRPAAYEGHAFPLPVRSIRLVVDFVGFADGTTWGADKHKSADRLTGHHAGIKAEAGRLLGIKRSKGSDGVLSALTSEEVAAPPPGRSSQWAEGFRGGASALRGRLKRLHGQGKAAEVEEELRRGAASAGRRTN